MSTLRCTNLQDTAGGNSLTTAQIYNGAAKAWVNFNGTGTVAIRAQFNVSSITDNGTGDYTVNFTTAMPDASFSAVISRVRDGSIQGNVINDTLIESYASGAVRVIVYQAGSYNFGDNSTVSVSVFR